MEKDRGNSVVTERVAVSGWSPLRFLDGIMIHRKMCEDLVSSSFCFPVSQQLPVSACLAAPSSVQVQGSPLVSNLCLFFFYSQIFIKTSYTTVVIHSIQRIHMIRHVFYSHFIFQARRHSALKKRQNFIIYIKIYITYICNQYMDIDMLENISVYTCIYVYCFTPPRTVFF